MGGDTLVAPFLVATCCPKIQPDPDLSVVNGEWKSFRREEGY